MQRSRTTLIRPVLIQCNWQQSRPVLRAGSEGSAYSVEEISLMLKVLPEPAATIVATAAYTGLRLGELRGLVWEAYTPPADEDSLGCVFVTRSVWRSSIGEPKTQKSKAPVPVIPQLADRLAAHRSCMWQSHSRPNLRKYTWKATRSGLALPNSNERRASTCRSDLDGLACL